MIPKNIFNKYNVVDGGASHYLWYIDWNDNGFETLHCLGKSVPKFSYFSFIIYFILNLTPE